MCTQKSEDSLQASVLAFSDLNSGERPQVIRLGSQHLNLLSHAGLASPWIYAKSRKKWLVTACIILLLTQGWGTKDFAISSRLASNSINPLATLLKCWDYRHAPQHPTLYFLIYGLWSLILIRSGFHKATLSRKAACFAVIINWFEPFVWKRFTIAKKERKPKFFWPISKFYKQDCAVLR